MAIPRSKHTRSRRNKGRLHQYLKKPAVGICVKCGKEVQPHVLCWNCGYYKGVEVVNVLEKLTKKEKKKREKEMAQKEKEERKPESLSMEGLSKK